MNAERVSVEASESNVEAAELDSIVVCRQCEKVLYSPEDALRAPISSGICTECREKQTRGRA